MKNTNETLTEQTVRQKKNIENFKENSFSLHCPLFRDGCRGSSSRLSNHTSRSSSHPSFCLCEVPSNSTQDPQCNIDSYTVVQSRPTVFFFFRFALASKACLGRFS